jgi:hypothetical protein
VTGPANGWRDQGGDPELALEYLVKYGACPANFMDTPLSLTPKRWKTGWETARAGFKVLEWRDLLMPGHIFDCIATAAFRCRPGFLGFNRWSHEISGPYRVILVEKKTNPLNNVYAITNRNNWGVWGLPNQSTPNGKPNGWVNMMEQGWTPDINADAIGQVTAQ